MSDTLRAVNQDPRSQPNGACNTVWLTCLLAHLMSLVNAQAKVQGNKQILCPFREQMSSREPLERQAPYWS